MRYRKKGRHIFTIQVEILWFCMKEYRLITHVMYKVNVHHKTAKELLKKLVKNGLLTEKKLGNNSFIYKTTVKGLKVVNIYRDIEGYLNE